jgi:DNA-binding transcriptional regulator YhcF (GntR family)
MAISGTTFGPELLVELDRAAPEPLHRQLANGLRDAIRTGRLAPATRLPSTRVLAADLGVSRRLVVDAYSQLAAEGFLLSRHGSGTRVATVDAAGLSRATPAILRSSSTSTSRPAHRISVAFRGMPGYGRCGKASPRSSRTHSAMSHRRVCPLHASQWRTICGALAACSPTRGTSCCAQGQHRPSPCWPQCYPIRRWRWRIQGSGCIGWCCDTTVSSPYQFRSMRTGWTSRASRTAMRRWCWPPRPIKHRPVWCSPQLA